MSHYLQNEYFRDEEPDDGEYVVERGTFRPKEDVVDVVNRMLYRFVFLAILLMGIILTFTYKERIFNPPPGRELVKDMETTDIEIQLENKRLQGLLKNTQEQNDVMKLVNARHLDPDFPLNNYNRELIIKNWPHVIQGYTNEEIQATLEILDMRYDENGLPRSLTPEEVAVLDKKYGKNRKIRHKLNSAMMISLGAGEDVLPEEDEGEEIVAAEDAAAESGAEKPVIAKNPVAENGNGKENGAAAEKSPDEPPKNVVKRKKKEKDPLRAELMDFVMGQTQQMVDSVLNPVSLEPDEEEEYEEYEEEVEEEEEVKEPVRLAPAKVEDVPAVEEKVPEVYDVDALDAALGVKKNAEKKVPAEE